MHVTLMIYGLGVFVCGWPNHISHVIKKVELSLQILQESIYSFHVVVGHGSYQ